MRTVANRILFFCIGALSPRAGLPLAAAEGFPAVLDPRLKLELYCQEPEIVTPIGLEVDSRGRVWAIESHTHFPKANYPGPTSDRVLIFEEVSGGGRAGSKTIFAEGFRHAMGLKLRDDRALYLATRREVSLLEDRDGDLKSDAALSLARLETRGDYPHNGLSGFAIDDLDRVYFGLGENLGAEYRLIDRSGASWPGGGEGGSIYRMLPDGSGLERWATGFWNPFHLGFDAFGNLFAVDNDPDSRPPCRLLHIIRGGDYGYRFWLGRKGLHPFTSWNGELPGTLPMACGTGEAPSGVADYEHLGLPEDYRGGLFVTSWGDHRLEFYRLESRGASYQAEPRPVVQGDDHFRPVGVAVAPDGSIFFSDWVLQDYEVHGQGRIWQLSSREKKAAASAFPRLRLPGAGWEETERLLSHPVRAVRQAAARDLSRHPEAERLAAAVLANSKSARGKYHALVALARGGKLGRGHLQAVLSDLPEVAAACVRFLGDTGRMEAAASCLPALFERPLPPLHLELLLNLPEDFSLLSVPLDQLLLSGDPFLASGALVALERGESREALGRLAASAEPGLRLAALLALRRRGEGEDRLEKFLADPEPAVRQAALQWVGERGLKAHRRRVEEILQEGSLSRELFDAALAAASLLNGENPQERDQQSRDEFLLRIARDRRLAPTRRAGALRSVSPRHPGLSEEALQAFLAEPDGALRLEAARSLREKGGDFARGRLRALALDPREDLPLRREAVIGLALFAGEEKEALEKLKGDPEPLLCREAARSLKTAASPEAADPASEPRPEGWKEALLGGGDPREGEIVFFHPKGPRCYGCHAAGGRGGEVGPDLSAAGRMPPERLRDSVLEPGKEIAPQFATWIFVATDGPHTGILLGEEADGTVKLGNAQGEVERLPRRSIRSREQQKTSIMPEKLADPLTFAELRDLLAFLRSLR
ncbi:MAG: hypothetical protein HY717_01445 [Planctomycetes bacterium]|nr:hypothetical protein [Planctomycetota bacterium]